MNVNDRLTAHFAHPGVLVSVLVPGNWTVSEVAPQQIRFFGPEQPDLDHYSPTFSIALQTPGDFGDEWFDRFCDAGVERLRESCDDFTLRSVDRFPLSSLADVHATWYEWQAAPDHRSAQLQAMISVDRYRFYLINAATRAEIADDYLPLFDAVLRSLRLLQPRS